MSEKEFSIGEFAKLNELIEMFNDEVMGIRIVSEDDLFYDDDYDDEYDDYDAEEGDADLGKEDDIDDALNDDELIDGDICDDALMELIDEVAEEYEEESAVNAVYDAVASLVQDGIIDDVPGMSASNEEKALWVQNSIPKIRLRLQELGIELESGAESVGGAQY